MLLFLLNFIKKLICIDFTTPCSSPTKNANPSSWINAPYKKAVYFILDCSDYPAFLVEDRHFY